MIVVLTHSYFEQGTDPVVDWLLFHKQSFIRICVEDLIKGNHNYYIDIKKGRVFFNKTDISDDIKVVFYRRFYRYIDFEDTETMGRVSRKLFYESNYEIEDFVKYLYKILNSKIWFPHYDSYQVNKLEVVYKSSLKKIKTPNSIVTNNKSDLKEFAKKNKDVVYKPIGGLGYYTFGRYTYYSHTTSLTPELIDGLPEFFVPSLFQERVKADFEIRVFYLDSEFYATAALSSDIRRSVDLKKSFYNNTLRWVPYTLPEKLKNELHALMKDLNLNTGSIDVIRDKNGKYYFLEVNPVGQYSAPSYESNYYVEKLIAQWLIKKDNQ
jgi:hypothetical protein